MLLGSSVLGGLPAPPARATNAFEQALAARLASLADVLLVAGGNVFPSRRPQKRQLPCLTYRIVSKPRDPDLDGPAGIARARVQVSAWSHRYGDAKQLVQAVRAGLPIGFRGLLGPGVVVTGTTHTGESDLAEAPTDGTDDWTYQITFDLKINYRE